MTDGRALLTRGDVVLRPDPRRVITKLFLPGQELLAGGIPRSDAVIQRVLELSDDQVAATLSGVLRRDRHRHHRLIGQFADHFASVQHRIPHHERLSTRRRLLIGAYCTQEYAIEAAALMNPSMVQHPDQSGIAQGAVRFVMSARAVGEGHLSSIEFRTGVVRTLPDGGGIVVAVDEPAPRLVVGRTSPLEMSQEFLRSTLAERSDRAQADPVLRLLRAHFTATKLEAALVLTERDPNTAASSEAIIERIREIAAGHYQVTFPRDVPISARVLYPTSAGESQGMEDARFTPFVEDDGTVSFYATYTAFDGRRISPRLLHTSDFGSFQINQLTGPGARDKGMALFPRRIGGRFVALTRWDRENIGITTSTDTVTWDEPVTVQQPRRPWELIQLGNCGPPIETPSGWLVLTHGVGPMRRYAVGAMLLDRQDPTRVLGVLTEPLLTPNDDERDGYVPNVVYSCGALRHGRVLVMPYGCSDSTIRFAYVDLPTLLQRLGV